MVLVRLLPVKQPVLHWQNAFAGHTRQAVAVEYADKPPFYLDNGDGQGLFKVEGRGGPEYGSRHLQPGAFEIVAQVDESQWQKYDARLLRETEESVEKWGKEMHPEEWQNCRT